MGLSAIDRLGHCNDPGDGAAEQLIDEVALLAEVIAVSAGSLARDLSASLINRFGSLAAVLSSSDDFSDCGVDIPDRVANSLSNMANAVGNGWKKLALGGQVLSSSKVLHQYLRMDMASHHSEQFRVLFLNPENRLIDDQTMWRGTVNAVQVHPREIVREAIRLHATAIILVHNHPSGSALPSEEDASITKKIMAACAVLDIHVHDHIIIGNSATYSMRLNRPIA